MPVCEAASISSTSGWRPSMMARQCTPSAASSTSGSPLPSSSGEIQPARKDARGRRLADAAHAGQHPGMRDAARREGILQRPDHRLLADQVVEARRAVFPRENLVAGSGFGHGALTGSRRPRCVRRERGKREAGQATRAESRWGCFLPDLTRLASDTSAANLPPPYIAAWAGRRKWRRDRAQARPMFFSAMLRQKGAHLPASLRLTRAAPSLCSAGLTRNFSAPGSPQQKSNQMPSDPSRLRKPSSAVG